MPDNTFSNSKTLIWVIDLILFLVSIFVFITYIVLVALELQADQSHSLAILERRVNSLLWWISLLIAVVPAILVNYLSRNSTKLKRMALLVSSAILGVILTFLGFFMAIS